MIQDSLWSGFESRDLARHPEVAGAILQGATSTGHARGIAKGMAELPRTLDASQRGHAEAVFLRFPGGMAVPPHSATLPCSSRIIIPWLNRCDSGPVRT